MSFLFSDHDEVLFADGFRGTYIDAKALETAENPCAAMPHEILPLGEAGALILIDLQFDADCTIPSAPRETIGSISLMTVLTGRATLTPDPSLGLPELDLGLGSTMVSRIEEPLGRLRFEGGSRFRSLIVSLFPPAVDELLERDWGELREPVRRLLQSDRAPVNVPADEEIRAIVKLALATPLVNGEREDFLKAMVPGYLAAVARRMERQPLAIPAIAEPSLIELACHARDRLVAQLDAPPPVEEIAEALGSSARTLSDALRAVFGFGPAEVVREARLLRARHSLIEGSTNLDELAASAGYGHVTNFTTAFRKRFNVSPMALLRVSASESSQ